MPLPKLILASGSPRRRQLLADAGYELEVLAPDEAVECGVCSESGPAGLVAELAYRKAAAVKELLERHDDWDARTNANRARILVAADTVAECDGFVLGKPPNEAAATQMLRQLRGRPHRVLTGLCVWPVSWTEPLVRVAVTELRMDELSDTAIDAYVASGQWEGKAGGFGYQDRLGWVHVVSGSETNVVGLPMELLAEMLEAAEKQRS